MKYNRKLQNMTNSQAIEYLEKYLVAPSPSRDYYGIKVIRDQVILYIWKISHGPHTNPIVRVSKFCDFNQDKTMQNEIQRVFGDSTFWYVQKIAEGNENSLVTLPKHLIKKITKYLPFKDVLKLCTLSRMANEVFDSDVVWEVLYKRNKMGLIYKDERVQGSSHGWKQLFKERQMHKPARERKTKKLPVTEHLDVSRSFVTSKQNPGFMPLKNRKGTSITKLIETEIVVPKLMVRKNCPKVKEDEKTKKNVSTILKTVNSAKNDIRNKTNSEIFATTPKDKTSRGVGKNCELRSKSSLKSFSNLGLKSNPTSGRKMKSKTLSSTESSSSMRLHQRPSKIIEEKNKDSKFKDKISVDKSCEVSATKQDFNLEDLIRESIIGDGLSSENLLPLANFLTNRYSESDSNLTERSTKKFFDSNLCSAKKRSAISRKFSSKAETKSGDLVERPKVPATCAKRFADIKVHLKSGNKNFRDKKLEPEDSGLRSDESVKSSFKNRSRNETLTKYESLKSLKNKSCENGDSKITAIESSRRFIRSKKYENLNNR